MIRRWLFPFWGAEEDDDGDEGGEGDGPAGENQPGIDPPPSTRELTAEEIENMTARAADRASRKARKDLAAEFGFESQSDMKDYLRAKTEADKEAMDEKDRAIAEAEEARREAEALRSNLASDRLDTAVLRHVVSAGVSDEKKLSRITALVRLDLDEDVVNDEESWEEAITEALSSVKEDTPELFGGSGAKGHGSGDGGARGDSTTDPDTDAERDKKYTEQFEGKGLVSYDPSSF